MSRTSHQTHMEANAGEQGPRRPNGGGLRGPLNWFGVVFGAVVLIGAAVLVLTDGSDPADDGVAAVAPAVEQAPVDEHDETADEAADEATEPGHSDDATAPMVDATGMTVIEIEMVEFAYRPDTVEIQAGVPVIFRFTNTGNFEHEAMVGDMHQQEEFEADGDHEADDGHHGDVLAVLLQPGETADLEVLIDEPGTTYMACHVRGHYEQGQIATINVVA